MRESGGSCTEWCLAVGGKSPNHIGETDVLLVGLVPRDKDCPARRVCIVIFAWLCQAITLEAVFT